MEVALFYLLGAATLTATFCAITNKNAVHAILYLVLSFFALSVIFYLLGAPTVAAFEVIIYAGAIMVLFLFVIMMLDLSRPERIGAPRLADWWPAALVFAAIILSLALLAVTGERTAAVRPLSVRELSVALFQRYGVAVELVSMQLLFALVGALYLGRRR